MTRPAPTIETDKNLAKRPDAIEVERGLDNLARWMDGLIRIPVIGTRIGLDSILGLIPGVGDTTTALASFYILAAGVRYRVPKVTLLRMGLNIGLDYVVGTIPLVGDLFDVWWKSNQRNMELIKQRATVSAADAKDGRTSDWLFVLAIIGVLVLLLFGSIIVSLYILRWLFERSPLI